MQHYVMPKLKKIPKKKSLDEMFKGSKASGSAGGNTDVGKTFKPQTKATVSSNIIINTPKKVGTKKTTKKQVDTVKKQKTTILPVLSQVKAVPVQQKSKLDTMFKGSKAKGTLGKGTGDQIVNGQRIAGYDVGFANTIPVSTNDDFLTQLGKQIVNGIVGIPKTALGVLGLTGEGLRQIPIQGASLLSGKGFKEYKSPTTAKDLLGTDWNNELEKFKKQHPTLGNLATAIIDLSLDPINFVGVGEASSVAKGLKGLQGATDIEKAANLLGKNVSDMKGLVTKSAQKEARIIADGITTKVKSGVKLTEGEKNIVINNPKTFGRVKNIESKVIKPITQVEQDAQKVYKASESIKANKIDVNIPNMINKRPKILTKEYGVKGSDVSEGIWNKKPLSDYTDTLYRESSVDGALKLLGIKYNPDGIRNAVYFSNVKEMALGQGKNKGILLEFHPNDNIMGIVDTKKPTWEHQFYQNNIAEFKSTYNNPQDYFESLTSITIKKGTTGNGVDIKTLKETISEWERKINPDGSTTYTKPVEKVYKASQDVKNNPVINNKAVKTTKPRTPAQETFLKNKEANRKSLEGTAPVKEETPIAKIITQKELKPKKNIKELSHNAYTHAVDVYHPLNRLDVVKDVNPSSRIANTVKIARDSRGTAEHIIDTELVDKIGKPISRGYKKILKAIKKDEESLFAEYLTQKHNVSRMKYDKPIYGKSVTSGMSSSIVRQMEKARPEFKKASEELNQFMKNLADEWGVKSGRVSKESMNYLHQKYPDYIPIYRANDPNYLALQKDYTLSSGKFIKTATGGSSDIVSPLDTIPMYINSVVKKARQNETYQAILNAVRKNPDEMAKKGVTITQTGKDTLEELAKIDNIDDITNFDQLISAPKTGNLLIVMENGKPVTLKINDQRIVKALQELQTGHINGAVEKVLRKGTNVFKAPITTYNPVFAVNNIARDIPTAIINSKGNPLKQIKNTFSGVGDMISKDPLYKQYSALSGRGGNFFSDSIIKNNFITNFNNMSEDMSRFAAFKTAVEKGKGSYDSVIQGLADAKDITVDFGRYGDWTKIVDAATPYLNAGVQGIDKFFRQVAKHPASTIGKGVAFITSGKIALDIVNSNNPYYKKLSRYNRDNNYCIPNIFGEKDENGIPKTFIKIKMPREYGVIFGSLVDRLTQKQQGLDDGFKDFADTIISNFSPASPITNNIFAPFVYNLPSNKTWNGSPIVSQSLGNLPNNLQYDEKTSSIAKGVGNLLNVSPKQIDYIIKSYTGIFGQFLQPITTEANQGKNIGDALKNTLKSQFTLDPLYSNDAQNDFYTNLDKISKKKTGSELLGVKFNDNLSSGMIKASADMSMLRKMMKQVELDKKLTNTQKTAKMRVYQQKIVDIAERYNKLYEKGDNSVNSKYPEIDGTYYPNNYFTRDGIKYTMNTTQYEEYQKIVEKTFKLLYNRFKSKILKEVDRIKAIEDCKRQAEDYAKNKILPKLK